NLADKFPQKPKCLDGTADCQVHWAWVLGEANRFQEAEQAARRALSIWKKLAAASPGDGSYRWHVCDTYGYVANYLRRQSKLALAIDTWRESVAHCERRVADFNDAGTHRTLALHLDELGDSLAEAERQPEAEVAYAKACAIWQKLVNDANL